MGKKVTNGNDVDVNFEIQHLVVRLQTACGGRNSVFGFATGVVEK